MDDDWDTLIERSQQYFWLQVTALLEYINLVARFLLTVFDAVFLHELSSDTARKCVNFKSKLFLIPFTIHNSKNYSGIIYACLKINWYLWVTWSYNEGLSYYSGGPTKIVWQKPAARHCLSGKYQVLLNFKLHGKRENNCDLSS